MKILTTLVLSVVSVGLLGSGCASDESTVTSLSGSGAFQDGGAAGSSGAGGAPGTGGSAGMGTAGTGAAPMGSCNPTFCPERGGGTGCCVTPNGPCGVDFGTGCMGTMPDGG